MKLGRNEKAVLIFLARNPEVWFSPTKIGTTVTGDPAKHSTWACPVLKRLIAKELVEKNEDRHYRITPAGLQTVVEKRWLEFYDARRAVTSREESLLAQYLPGVGTRRNGVYLDWGQNPPTPEQVLDVISAASAAFRVAKAEPAWPKGEPTVKGWPTIPPKEDGFPFPNPKHPGLPDSPGIPPSNPIVLHCQLCGIEMHQMMHYCCPQPNCPCGLGGVSIGTTPKVIVDGSTQESQTPGSTEGMRDMRCEGDLGEGDRGS